MSSLLQSTGSSPCVLVHIVGPLAATIVRVPFDDKQFGEETKVL